MKRLVPKVGGRPVYTKGPVIFALEIVQLLTGLLAIAALVVAIGGGLSLYHDIQHERYDSSLNTCYAIRHLVFAAYPPKYRVAADRALRQAGLSNCDAVARRIVSQRG